MVSHLQPQHTAGELKQKEHEFKISLRYAARAGLKTNIKTNKKRVEEDKGH